MKKGSNKILLGRVLLLVIVSTFVVIIALYPNNSTNQNFSITGNVVLNNYSGLPAGYAPAAADYHSVNDNPTITLVKDGSTNISSDGTNFNSGVNLIDLNVPTNFNVNLIYYIQRDTGEKNVIFYSDQGVSAGAYFWDGGSQASLASPASLVAGGLSSDFVPATAYYRNFSGSHKVTLTGDENGQTAFYSRTYPSSWSKVSSNDLISANLPTTITPAVSYAFTYNNGESDRIHIWYPNSSKSNGHQLMEWSNLSPPYADVTSSLSGLPDGIPTKGYYDAIRHKAVIWFGEAVYESSNMRDFTHVHGSDGVECSEDDDCGPAVSNLQCQSGNVYNVTITPTCTSNSCSNSTTEINVQNCSFGCASGECLPQQDCTSADDCSLVNELICSGGILLNHSITPSCTNNLCNISVPFNETNHTTETCEFGCDNTNLVCLSQEITQELACEDTDAEINGLDAIGFGYYEQGNVSFLNETNNQLTIYEDQCINGTILREWFCGEAGNAYNETYECPDGCSEGKCLGTPDESCFDSDNGRNYTEPGTLDYEFNGLELEYDDECRSNSVFEFFCSDDHPDFRIQECGDDEFCSSSIGACVSRLSSNTTNDDPDVDECTDGEFTCGGTDESFYIYCANGRWLEPQQIPGQCGFQGTGIGGDNIEVTRGGSEDAGDSGSLFLAIIILVIIIVLVLIAFLVYLFIKRMNNKRNPKPSGSTLSMKKKPRRPFPPATSSRSSTPRMPIARPAQQTARRPVAKKQTARPRPQPRYNLPRRR